MRVVVYRDRCTGCGVCTIVCSLSHEDSVGLSTSRITIEKPDQEIDKPVVCQQCGNPPCVPACPEEAIKKGRSTESIEVDLEKCTGCGECVESCPFGAITLHPQTGKALICDLCEGNPLCVRYCPATCLELMNDKSDR